MTLHEDFVRLASPEGGLFHGTSPRRLLAIFEALGDRQNMRTTTDGKKCNKTQLKMLSSTFCQKFGLTDAQYCCITELFDKREAGGVRAEVEASMPASVAGAVPTYVKRPFTADRVKCCSRTLRVREVQATCIEVNDCFSTTHIVKECVGDCGATYYLGKKVLDGFIDGQSCYWHLFDAWTDGHLPSHITNKSGSMIISTEFLTRAAIQQYKMRVGFDTIADLHAATARLAGAAGTTALTGPVLTECWGIFAVLKHKQGVRPWVWFAPGGQDIVAGAPQPVGIFAMRGGQSDANHWDGLRWSMDEVLSTLWERAGWTGHACDVCRKNIDFDGEVTSVEAAVVHGITATRRYKCTFHGCKLDLPEMEGQRFCSSHAAKVGRLCAVTWPKRCENNHQPERLTCTKHSQMESAWKQHNQRAGLHAQPPPGAAGNEHENDYMSLLRFMFSPRTTFGHMIGSYSCGIIAGITTLWESEGMEEVDTALNCIWPLPESRPELLFYDLACRRRRYLSHHPDPSWGGTIHLVDRSHFGGHTGADCDEFCNPERRSNPLLWHLDASNNPTFNWDSSVAESNNSFLAGLGPIVNKMPRILGQFVLSNNVLIHNELLLAEKLLGKNPTFMG